MPPGKLNPEVGEILRRVRGDLSLAQAAQRTGYALSTNAWSTLESGKIGREQTVRYAAEGFWQRFCELYGEQVAGRFGECTRQTVSDWLAEKAGFGLRYARRPEVAYEPNLDDLNAVGYGELDPSDRGVVRDLVRSLYEARRKVAE